MTMERVIQLPSRLHRVAFGRQLAVQPGEVAAVWRSSDAEEKMRMTTAIGQAKRRMQSVELDDGPYRDKEGRIWKLTDRAKKATQGNLHEVLHAVHDLLLPMNATRYLHPARYRSGGFFLDENLVRLEPRLMTAGEVLASPRENIGMAGADTEVEGVPIASDIELSCLGISILRHLGQEAYYGYAMPLPSTEGEGGVYPVIPILHNGNLSVFSLRPEVVWANPLVELHLLDDAGMLAYLHAMYGEQLAKRLAHDTADRIKEILQACHAGTLVEAIEQGTVRLGFLDLLLPEPRLLLAHERLMTPGQLETFEGRYRAWEDDSNIVDQIHDIAGALMEARQLYPDAHFMPDIVMGTIRCALPDHQFSELMSSLDGAVEDEGQADGKGHTPAPRSAQPIPEWMPETPEQALAVIGSNIQFFGRMIEAISGDEEASANELREPVLTWCRNLRGYLQYVQANRDETALNTALGPIIGELEKAGIRLANAYARGIPAKHMIHELQEQIRLGTAAGSNLQGCQGTGAQAFAGAPPGFFDGER